MHRAAVAIELPDGVDREAFIADLQTVLDKYKVPDNAVHRDRFERLDYMQFLCSHRTEVRAACTPLAYKEWPVWRTNVSAYPMVDSVRFDEKSGHVCDVSKWSKEPVYFRVLKECSIGTLKELKSTSLRDWKTKQVPVIYATICYDPLYQEYRTYVGQTKSYNSRWSGVATSTTRSHHNAIWQILKTVANARDEATARDLMLSSFQLCDLAYACSIVSHMAQCNPCETRGIRVLVCEELPIEAKQDKRTRDEAEAAWIDKLQAYKMGYNVQRVV